MTIPHPQKTVFTVFFQNKNSPQINLFLNGHKLEQFGANQTNKTTKFLGVLIDSKLTWEHHIESLKSKMRSIIHLLSSVKSTLPIKIKIMLFKSLLMPHVNYCLAVYGKGKGVQAISTYMKWGLRICANLRSYSHTNDAFKNHKILKFADMYELQRLQLGRKIATENCPSFYLDNFKYYNEKGRRKNFFETIMPHFKTKSTIYETIPCVWNKVKPEIEKSKSIFKKRAKERYFTNYGKITCTKKKCFSCGRT